MLQPRHASPPTRPGRAGRRRLAAAVAVVATVGLVSSASPGFVSVAVADTDIALSPGDRMLQSVDIEMGPDGTLNSVESNAVAATSDGSPSDTATDTFSPDEVVDDLPVRVVTSYRTADGAGTDLSDLKGYTGKVAIDLTVQNLTVGPQDISYDVDGASRSQAALVGVPLTVVASTALPDVPGASVITAEKDGGDAAGDSTNGVLSQDRDGVTQVQWATILAPPQLGSSARLSLVVDAKDFTPPSFDLSVQPGLVTDTSVGALVQSVFDPQASDELRLQARTIKVIGEVNQVLGRAGSSISTVRSTLNASAETLGQKTVSDLKSSVTEITGSMRDLDGTITSLGDDLSSTLESTGSSSVQQLQQSVNLVDRLLGDTSAQVTTAPTKGSGCDVEVGTTGAARTVFGSLLRVGGRLQAFSDATAQCKSQLQQSIVESIGPPKPDAENCFEATSVTCSIYSTAGTFAGISATFAANAAKAKDHLDQESSDNAYEAAENLLARATALNTAVQLLDGDASSLMVSLDGIRTQRDAVSSALAGIQTDVGEEITSTGSAISLNAGVARQICEAAFVNPFTNQSALDEQTARNLLAQMVEEYPAYNQFSCTLGQDADGNKIPLDASGSIQSTEKLLTEQQVRLTDIKTSLNTSYVEGDDNPALGEAFENLDLAIDELDEALNGAVDENGDRKSIKQLADDVYGQAFFRVVPMTKTVSEQYAAAAKGIDDAVAAAQEQAETDVDAKIQEGIRQVTEQAQQDRADVGRAFDKSTAGLRQAGRDIVADGKSTVDSQRKDLTKGQRQSARGIERNVDQGLTEIASGVRTSTRDNKAVTTLLTADLTKVLQDIGQSGNGGSGLLGSLSTNAATAGAADFQVSLATRTTSSYANVRGQDIAGILLRQAQSEASLQAQARMPAFGIDVPTGVERRTVYTFHVAGQ